MVDGLSIFGGVQLALDATLVPGFEVPGWLELARGARPALRNVEEFEPGCQRTGWQHEAAVAVERERERERERESFVT